MATQVNNTKYAFLKKANIATSIANKSVDAYDYIFCTDTKELYVLDKTLTPHRVQARLKVYSSLATANRELTTDSSFYAGEIITVKVNGSYVPYIVNDIGGTFSLTDMSGGLVQLKTKIELPTFGNENKLYLVKNIGNDLGNEIYAWNGNGYDLISSDKSYREITLIDGGDSVHEIKSYT